MTGGGGGGVSLHPQHYISRTKQIGVYFQYRSEGYPTCYPPSSWWWRLEGGRNGGRSVWPEEEYFIDQTK